MCWEMQIEVYQSETCKLCLCWRSMLRHIRIIVHTLQFACMCMCSRLQLTCMRIFYGFYADVVAGDVDATVHVDVHYVVVVVVVGVVASC